MKQRYKLVLDIKNKQFIIQEYAEIDGEKFYLMCEDNYDLKELEKVVNIKKKLSEFIKNHNIYPPTEYMEIISKKASSMIKEMIENSVEINFDDKEISKNNIIKNSSSNEENDNNNFKSISIEKLINETFEGEKYKLNKDEKSISLEDKNVKLGRT